MFTYAPLSVMRILHLFLLFFLFGSLYSTLEASKVHNRYTYLPTIILVYVTSYELHHSSWLQKEAGLQLLKLAYFLVKLANRPHLCLFMTVQDFAENSHQLRITLKYILLTRNYVALSSNADINIGEQMVQFKTFTVLLFTFFST